MEWTPLHVHTEMSNASLAFADSLNKVEEVIDYAIELGLHGIAITDHECLSAHVRAEQHLDKLIEEASGEEKERLKQFKLIKGNEIYLAREDMSAKTYKSGDRFYHFILLAKDEIGFKQLRDLSTRAWNRSFYRAIQRRFNYISDLQEIIGQNPGHVIATTACIGGITGTYFLSNLDLTEEQKKEQIESFINLFENIFGKENFYVELAPSDANKDQSAYNQYMIKNYYPNHKFIITTDAHYLKQEDFRIFKVFLNSKSSKDREVEDFYKTTYLMDWDELHSFFKGYNEDFLEECRINTNKIADSISDYRLAAPVKIPQIKYEYHNEKPNFKMDISSYEFINDFLNSPYEIDRYFLYKIFENYDTLIEDIDVKTVYDRIDLELSEIWKISDVLNERMSYYLITMQKIIDIIWEEADAIVGPSRGSAGSFIIDYLLQITQWNPLKYPLKMEHWRFIHHSRVGLPDIDIDCAGNKKEEVIAAVKKYFNSLGGDLIQVGAYKTEASRSALKTAAKGLGLPNEISKVATSLLDSKRGFFPTLYEAYNGSANFPAVKEFKNLMDSYPEWWEVAQKIENLVTGISAHAAGVLLLNDPVNKRFSIMKTTTGIPVTAWDLHEVEYMGGLKYDFLSTDSEEKITTCLNFLLQDGLIEWKGSLRETYKALLYPDRLRYSDEMWKQIQNNEIVSLFQLNTPVGTQALATIHPQNIKEVGMINSLMRLQPQKTGDEQPLETFRRYRENIQLWYDEMNKWGLTQEEVKIMEEHLLPLYGIADTQEAIMMLTMDSRIANFSMKEADKLRKGVAKKNKQAQEEVRELFYKRGKENGTRIQLLDYVWKVQISRQLGYSFSLPHVAGYSYVAIQEANLYSFFPHIYWNTAVLCSEAGADTKNDFEDLIEKGYMKKTVKRRTQEEQLYSDFIEDYQSELDPDELEEGFQEYLQDYAEEEEQKAENVKRGKIATAISKFQKDFKIAAPDINISGFGFKPDPVNNTISCGLKVVSKIGDKLIKDIIKNRPYTSIEDLLSKVKVSKDRVCLLIKAGCFRNIYHNEDNIELLKKYVISIADTKKTLNLRNVQYLIENDMLPDTFYEEKKLFNWVKYVRKHKYDSSYFVLDERSYKYYLDHFDDESVITKNGERIVSKTKIESYYKKKMEVVKNYIKNNLDDLLEQVNTKAVEKEWNKYGCNSISEGEMQSMRIYLHEHPLAHVQTSLKISTCEEVLKAEELPPLMIKGKMVPMMKLHHILGTVIDKNKLKNSVTLLTPTGVLELKVWKQLFVLYDKKEIEFVNGEKRTVQPSFFENGTYLLVTGAMRGENFIPKKYKNTPIDDVIMKVTLTEDKHLIGEVKYVSE